MWHYAKDNEKHGPISQEQIVGLMRSGALRDHDLVWREGMAEWLALSAVIELQQARFATQVATQTTGGAPGAAVAPVAPVGVPQNGMAITSLVLGIVSIMAGTLILTAIPGAICGHIARRQIRESPHAQAGDGMAIAGLILSYIAIILTLAVIVMFIVLFASLA